MDLKDIKSLIQFISKLDLPEVNIEVEGVKVHVKKNYSSLENIPNIVQSTPGVPNTNFQPVNSSTIQEIEKGNSSYISINSPMIGTFYSKPSPEKKAFVEVGKQIQIGDSLCVIEAMKLFNEIEAEVSGKIVKILVKEASPVEFGQPLFLVDPS